MLSSPDSFRADLQINPRSSIFAEDDSVWQRQVADLLRQLRDADVPIHQAPGASRPGEKGTTEAILLALGSSGAITAIVAIFKAWLARSGDRAIVLSGEKDGRKFQIEVNARNVDEETLRQALGLAAKP